MSKKNKGSDEFNKFYSEIYEKRWPELKKSLSETRSLCAWKNPFKNGIIQGDFYNQNNIFYENINESQSDIPGEFYFLDGASVFSANSLGVVDGMKVLDMCASPGGKSLLLASNLSGNGELVLNDLSKERYYRLQRTFKSYLPDEILSRIRFYNHDATKWCLYEQNVYDRILLDAPCSSEEHVLNSKKHLDEWSQGRTKRLSKLQYALLSSAFIALKPGGEIIYSTCSISPLENDGVIERFLKKRGEFCKVLELRLPIGERSKYGVQIFPDKTQHGPMYICKLSKNLME
ncbi:MAG: RsmB/NOP family class I SAM-dependent RNA methyltransferase [Halobacteriovoraceae bacterium]|nr:RsmB/NOP family class I SAM-dependent RNA methyltransferase [Halobacteriovoraceae bacterium]